MVSSKDVAKLANVSQTTVSRVLNNPDKVKRKTYEKVMRAIKELNYYPDPVARSLVIKQTKTIGLISGPLQNPFFVEATTEIVDYSNERDYKVNVHFTNDDKEDITYRNLFENKVDGIIMSSILYEDPIYAELKKLNIPVLFFNRRHKEDCNFVEIDNESAGYIMTKHLIERGYKKIKYITGKFDKSTFNNRYLGFKKCMNEYGYQYNEEDIIFIDTSMESIEHIFNEIKSDLKNIDAIAAATDSIALKMLDMCLKNQIAVPKDIAIAGIDNVDQTNAGFTQVTSVGGKDNFNLGRIAIEQLFLLIENKVGNVEITKEVELFARKTT